VATKPKAPKEPFACTECGWRSSKWVGRCQECQTWGSVVEVNAPKKLSLTPTGVSAPASPISEISTSAAIAQASGISELDRVLGGGLTPGSAILLAGEPGVGKSTLLLEVAAACAKQNQIALYVSGEESAAQVRIRASRIGAIAETLYLATETELGAVISQIDQVKPNILIIDSIQTITATSVEGIVGGVVQVREVASALIRIAKDRNITTILVGHVTKDGNVAGPRLLEHLVDVVLNFEGDPKSRLRFLRSIKNRFGACDEVGCFDMKETGIVSLTDPTGLFTNRHANPVPGTCVTVSLEGKRSLLTEIQALVGAPLSSSGDYINARRVTSGLESARTAMTLAVIEIRAGIKITGRDTYVATVGGMKITEPAADLAVALAVASAARNLALPTDLVAIGEVGLAGEIRQVTAVNSRLQEALRQGFRRAIVPVGSDVKIPGLEIVEVARIDQALSKVAIN
jgi:DNA repair protein RadA/Sms